MSLPLSIFQNHFALLLPCLHWEFVTCYHLFAFGSLRLLCCFTVSEPQLAVCVGVNFDSLLWRPLHIVTNQTGKTKLEAKLEQDFIRTITPQVISLLSSEWYRQDGERRKPVHQLWICITVQKHWQQNMFSLRWVYEAKQDEAVNTALEEEEFGAAAHAHLHNQCICLLWFMLMKQQNVPNWLLGNRRGK